MFRNGWGALIVVMIGAFLLLGGFSPADMPFIPGAGFSDAVTSHLPAAVHLREAFTAEEIYLPLWRETTFAGAPFAANPLNKTGYPLQWIALVPPSDLFLNGMIVLHLLIAAWGMWRWARSVGIRTEAAAFTAIAYALSPRLIAHLGAGHLDIVYAMAWLPWLMERVKRLSLAATSINLISVGVAGAFLVLADVRIGLFGVFTAAVYGFSLTVRKMPTVRLIGFGIGAASVILILSAAVIFPVLSWSPYLSRAALTQADAGIFALEPFQFLGTVLPLQRSNPETLTYLGIPVLILAIGALVGNFRRHVVTIGVIAFFAVYAMGEYGGLWTLLTGIFPPLLYFRVPSRAWIIVALLVIVLAGYGAHALINAIEKRRASWRAFAALFLIAVVFTEAVLITGRNWLEWRGWDQWVDPYIPIAERIMALEPDRIYAPAYSLPQHIAQFYHLRLFGGVDPFQVDDVTRAIREAGGITDNRYSVVIPPLIGVVGDNLSMANQGARLDLDRLAAWSVSHIIAPYPIEQDGLTLIDTVDGIAIYANDRYTPDPRFRQQNIPRWSQAETVQPDANTVARLGQVTTDAHLITAIGFAVCAVVGVYSGWRKWRGNEVPPPKTP